MSGGKTHDLFWESEAQGPLARLDPRLRLVAVIALVLLLPALHSYAALGFAILLGAAVAGVAQLSMALVLRRLAVMEGFLLLLLVSLPFTVGGEPAFHLGGLAASWSGLGLALAIMMRVAAAALVIAALLSGLGSLGLAAAMAGLGAPAALTNLFLLAFRNIGLLHEEYERLTRAMQARAFRPSTSAHAWTSLGQLLGMLLLRADERGKRLARAMKARGFAGHLHEAEPMLLGRHDLAFALLWGVALMGLMVVEKWP